MPTTRARTEAARDDRRDAILGAAEALLRRDGFEAVTVARVAEAAGLAKGTTYLYFRTREEVFLALFVRRLDAWAEALVAAPMPTPEALTAAVVEASARDETFLALLARLGAVIEQNLAREAFYEAKRAMGAAFGRVTARLGAELGLEAEGTQRLGLAVMAVLTGAAQACAARVPDDPAMPEDVREALALGDFRTLAEAGIGLAVAGAQRSSISM